MLHSTSVVVVLPEWSYWTVLLKILNYIKTLYFRLLRILGCGDVYSSLRISPNVNTISQQLLMASVQFRFSGLVHQLTFAWLHSGMIELYLNEDWTVNYYYYNYYYHFYYYYYYFCVLKWDDCLNTRQILWLSEIDQ